MLDFSTFPEVFVSDGAVSAEATRQTKAGKLRKIASRLYTRNLTDSPENLVARHLWFLINAYLPDALIADRTALENRPASDGSVFVISNHRRDIALPGLTLRPRKGPAALESDRAFIGSLRITSQARAFLENMRPSRARSGVARTLPKRQIEEKLDELLRQSGEPALKRLRDQARKIAKPLGLAGEFAQLDALIGALLGTRKAELQSPVAIARAAGWPYDPLRLDLFQALFAELANASPVTRLAPANESQALPFFEAYFSNFIEGTEFAVNEAVDIIFGGRIPKARPADAHDVLGTWQVVSDPQEMSRRPRDVAQLMKLLKSRHASVMGGRPEQGPGGFKTEANRAGSTLFVAPELVEGTLAKGFEMYRGLASPLHRAIFMMFLVAEVHPFADGNGRVARIMMNAELVGEGECRMIVPTIYRNNYLMALKALSQNRLPAPLLRTMDFAQRYTAAVNFTHFEDARRTLEDTFAFTDPNEAEHSGTRLTMPSPELLTANRR